MDVIVKEGITLSYDQDLVESVILPSKIETIGFEIVGKVYSTWQKKFTPISLTKTIRIFRGKDINLMYDLYLDVSNDDYTVRVLGKNGEPLKRGKFAIALRTKYHENVSSYDLVTDDTGSIHLGKLQNISRISVATKIPNVTQLKNSDLLENHQFLNLPPFFNIVEGEELCLPAHPK